MRTLEVTLLGPPRVAIGGVPVHVPLDKAIALLAYLAVSQTAQRRDLLAALLWPEADQSRARAYLRNALYLLTKSCGDEWFTSDRHTIALRTSPQVQVDVLQFLFQIEQAQRAEQPAAAITALRAAVALAAGDFLTGFSLPDAPEFEAWQRQQGETLKRKLDAALETLITYHQLRHEYAPAVAYAQRRVALDSLNEQAQRTYMQLLALSGQNAAALRHYASVVRLLDEELGVPPADATRAAYESIKDGQGADRSPPDAPPAPFDQPPLPLATSPALAERTPVPFSNLPQQLTPFVGREDELARLDKMLAIEAIRLITIVGPGGMGKTRLALACAERQVQQGRLRDGVAFVSLAAVTDPEHIASTIAMTLGYSAHADGAQSRTSAQQVANALRDKAMLLVLDNFEHLLEGTSFVAMLLQAAPQIRLLVTSRERLQMQAEHVLPILGLAYAPPAIAGDVAETAAMRLFLQAAERTAPGLSLDGAALRDVARVCSLVEGMPLGIELAAAWSDLLSPAEIATEIRRNLAFLAAEARDAPPRHHSIRAAFDATWQRLDAPEQEAFTALSVFHGGFTREAAREVAGATLEQLRTLVNKSLVQPDRASAPSHNRYGIHELLRQYGASKLTRLPETVTRLRDRHAGYFTSYLAARLGPINGPEQRQTADEIAAELDNVRAAWLWAVEQTDVEAIHHAATTLFLFCQLRSHFQEGAAMMGAAVACLAAAEPSRQRDRTLAQVLNHEGWLRIRLGQFEEATDVLEQSRALYRQPNVPPPPPYMGTDPATALAILAAIRGDHGSAVALGQEALDAARRRGDPYNQAHAHYALTSAYAATGDYAVATYHAREACTLAEAAGNRFFLAVLLDEWGKVARANGDYVQARDHFQASYAIKRAFNEPEGMAIALNHLGQLAILQDRPDEAEGLHQQALALYSDIGDRVGLATALRGLAQVAYARGDDARAREGFGAALAIAAETQYLPLIFAILIDLGHQLLLRGASPLGIRALVHVQEHPAADLETKQRAGRTLERFDGDLPSTRYAEAVAESQSEDLADIIAALQAALTGPGGDASLPDAVGLAKQ